MLKSPSILLATGKHRPGMTSTVWACITWYFSSTHTCCFYTLSLTWIMILPLLLFVLEDDRQVGGRTMLYIDTYSISRAYRKRNIIYLILTMISLFKIILFPLHFLWRSSLSSIKTMAKSYHLLHRSNTPAVSNFDGEKPAGKRETREIVRWRCRVIFLHPIAFRESSRRCIICRSTF